MFGKHLRRQRFVPQHEALVDVVRIHFGHMPSFIELFRCDEVSELTKNGAKTANVS